MYIIYTLVAALLAIIILPFLKSIILTSDTISRKTFHEHFGISLEENHFRTYTSDACNNDIIFKSILPSAVWKANDSPKSFLVLSRYGSGKTLLRCLYLKSLQSSDYLKVLATNQQVNEYLKRFVTETSIVGIPYQTKDYLIGWTKYEFAQIILSLSVTKFVNTFEKERFKLPTMSLDEKFGLLTIICYYYNDQSINKLEILVNAFLNKNPNSAYKINAIKSQIFEEDYFRDKSLLMHFKRDLKKLNTIAKDPKKLELLLGVMEGENYQNTAIDKIISDNVFQSLTEFTSFMKNDLKKPVVFVIDGIDENQYFFLDGEVDKVSLELFYRSSFSPEILASVMSQNFYLALFYPEVDGIDIPKPVWRDEQFPKYTIAWSSELLMNYANYVIEEMNKRASKNRIEALPHFKILVNYDIAENAVIMNSISTPRALHIFMTELIREMDKNPNDSQECFKATSENIKAAFHKLHQQIST